MPHPIKSVWKNHRRVAFLFKFFQAWGKSPMTLLVDAGAEELEKSLACMIHRVTIISILFTAIVVQTRAGF